jgi:hypothetical protein
MSKEKKIISTTSSIRDEAEDEAEDEANNSDSKISSKKNSSSLTSNNSSTNNLKKRSGLVASLYNSANFKSSSSTYEDENDLYKKIQDNVPIKTSDVIKLNRATESSAKYFFLFSI